MIIPITLPTTLLLDAFGISVDWTIFGEVSGEVVLGSGGPVGEASVVSIVMFFSSSH